MILRRSRGRLGLASVLLVAACARAPRDPVIDCLHRAAAAAEARDADGVLARVSEGYRDAAGGKAGAALLLKRYFAVYEWLSISLADVAVQRGDSSARARFTVRMSGRPRAVAGLEGLLPRASRWRFDVRLEAEKDGWRITEAAWERLEDDQAHGGEVGKPAGNEIGSHIYDAARPGAAHGEFARSLQRGRKILRRYEVTR